MNVLFLDQSSDGGGGQRCLADVIDESVRRGWRATVGLPGPGFLMDASQASGAEVVIVRSGRYRSYLRFGIDLVRQYGEIHSLVGDTAFDLVYVNGPRVLPAAVMATNGTALLFHAHNVPRPTVALRLAGLAAARATTVLCCCEFVANTYLSYVSSSKLYVVPNGIPEVGIGAPRPTHEGFRLGVVGRIEPPKGQLILVEALRLLRQDGLRCDLQLWGEGDSEYVAAMRRAARELSISIPGTGQIGQILSDLDLLVLPSTNEGMPRVLLEAFSAGIPVLAFPTGGVPEIVQHGKTGFLTEACTPAALATSIKSILAVPQAQLNQITTNARLAWEREYRSDLFRTRVAELMCEAAHRENKKRLQRRSTA